MIFVVGGSGSINPNNALIHVNAPTGSTVSFSKNGVIEKILPPSKAVLNIDGESADYYFSVSANNYGEWTIVAELNAETATDTVVVSTNNQYDVDLIYWNGEIYINGNKYETFTGGFLEKSFSRGGAVSGVGYVGWEETSVYLRNSNGKSGTLENWFTSICTANAIPFDKYRNLNIDFVFSTDQGNNDPWLFVASASSGNIAASPPQVSHIELPRTGIYTLDISSLTGSYYIGAAVSNCQAITVNRIWLS